MGVHVTKSLKINGSTRRGYFKGSCRIRIAQEFSLPPKLS